MSDRIEKAVMVIDETIRKAANVIAVSNGAYYGEHAGHLWEQSLEAARALAEAGLLAPAPLTEEWGTQYEDGSGPVWRETWDGKRIRTRKDADVEVSLARIPPQRTMRRYVTDWEAIE